MHAERSAVPLRLGAVDVGSNALRFAVAELAAPGVLHPVADGRVPVRLGGAAGLAPEVLDAAARALAGFRTRLDAAGVTHYRAVATSATRESRNGDELVRRAGEAGIELEVIDGAEEARLGFEAVRGRVPLGEARWLLADLGGGSLELSVVDGDGILWSESRPIGAVRLLRAGEDAVRLIRQGCEALGIAGLARRWGTAGLIATGGNIDALARLAGRDPRGAQPAHLPLDALRRTIARLEGMDARQRMERLGLRSDRADVILPAAHVYERVASTAGAAGIVVAGVGLREGILRDLANRLHSGPGPARPAGAPPAPR